LSVVGKVEYSAFVGERGIGAGLSTFCQKGKGALELNMIGGIWHIEVVKHPLYLDPFAFETACAEWRSDCGLLSVTAFWTLRVLVERDTYIPVLG